MTTSVIMSARDIRFPLHDRLDVESLTSRERFADHSRDIFDQVPGLGHHVLRTAQSRERTERTELRR